MKVFWEVSKTAFPILFIYFNQLQSSSKLICTVIGWNICISLRYQVWSTVFFLFNLNWNFLSDVVYKIQVWNLYYKVRCVWTLECPQILKIWDTQEYLWLPYDLTEVIKLIGVTFEQKILFFSKKYFMSFLPHYCHSFRITFIPSRLLSFLLY